MTFDLKAQPASISSAICGLRRIIIVFCFFQTNKMEWNGMNELINLAGFVGFRQMTQSSEQNNLFNMGDRKKCFPCPPVICCNQKISVLGDIWVCPKLGVSLGEPGKIPIRLWNENRFCCSLEIIDVRSCKQASYATVSDAVTLWVRLRDGLIERLRTRKRVAQKSL